MELYTNEIDKRFNTSEWKEVIILFKHNGKAPKAYGDGVYRFNSSMVVRPIMTRRGWELIKKSGNFVYMKPPFKVEKNQEFELKIKIPTDEQILHIAKQLDAEGKSRAGQIGEWPYYLIHKHKVTANTVENISQTGEVELKPFSTMEMASYFVIGERCIWCTSVELENDGPFFSKEGKIKFEG